MRWVAWDRPSRIKDVRRDIWKVVTPIAHHEEEAFLQAAALLQMRDWEVATLGSLQFLLSAEVGELVSGLPRLTRRLATTTSTEEETHPERIRGAILWGKTLSSRAASGSRLVYVTAPARRAYQTPENEVLVHVLDAVETHSGRLGWETRPETNLQGRDVREIVHTRLAGVQRWGRTRALTQVERIPPTARSIHRVATGRHQRAYGGALRAYERLRRLTASDPDAVREAIEQNAIVTRDDPTLFELLALFRVRDTLARRGWRFQPLGLMRGHVKLTATKGDRAIDLWYQRTPHGLAPHRSSYRQVLARHRFSAGELVPDIVVRERHGRNVRWLIMEMKMSFSGPLQKTARRAVSTLLAYRQAFGPVLSLTTAPYGIGIVWGEGLRPSPSDIVLCTPDRIDEALGLGGL